GEITASAIRLNGGSVSPQFRPSVSVVDPNSNDNGITLNTYLRVENSIYILNPNQAEVIKWAAAPSTATRVDFTFSPGDHSASRLLGSTTNLQSGASVNATFATGDFGIVSAEAFLRDGTHLFFARTITISAPAVQPPDTTAEANAEATAAQ